MNADVVKAAFASCTNEHQKATALFETSRVRYAKQASSKKTIHVALTGIREFSHCSCY